MQKLRRHHTRPNAHLSVLTAATALFTSCALTEATPETRSWTGNASGTPKYFTDSANWLNSIRPDSDDIALIDSGDGGTILLGTSGGTFTSIGTLQLNRSNSGTTSGYYAFSAGALSTAVSTLTFGASTSGIVWNPGTGTDFFMGGARFTRGQLVTEIDSHLAVRLKQNTFLGNYSTIIGGGSITVDTLETRDRHRFARETRDRHRFARETRETRDRETSDRHRFARTHTRVGSHLSRSRGPRRSGDPVAVLWPESDGDVASTRTSSIASQ